MGLAVIVDWYGPFDTFDEVRKWIAQKDIGESLYLALGATELKAKQKLQYVGIASAAKTRVTANHSTLKTILYKFQIWIGEVSSQAVAGRQPGSKATYKRVRHSTSVKEAERILAFFLEIPKNKSKRKSQPKNSTIVINRWFDKCEKPVSRRPHDDWPDYIEYESDYSVDEQDIQAFARMQWFGVKGRQRTLSVREIRNLVATA